MTKIIADYLVKNTFVISMNEERTCFERGAIAIHGKRIVLVGDEVDVLPKVRAAKVIDAGGAVTHPGFVDAHVHFMNTARGAFSDVLDTSTMMNTLRRWWDAVEEEDERAATFLNCLEMLSNGTTCFLEAGTLQFPDASAEAAEAVGMRGFIGDPFLWDLPAAQGTQDMTRAPRDLDRSLNLLGGQLKRNKEDALIKGCVVLFGLGSASNDLMRAAKERADQSGVIFSQHQSFDHHDTAVDEERLGSRPMRHYADCDLIGENCTFSHMNDLDPDEVGIVQQAKMSVVWCPVTSMNLGAKAARNAKHLEVSRGGGNVALASDGVSSGCRYDVGLQGLMALLSTRAKADSRTTMTALDVLELATIGGAKAVGMERDIGSIEVGKYADIVIRRSDLPEAQPFSDPIQSLVYNTGSKSIWKVIVNGELVWDERRPVRVEAGTIYSEAQQSHWRMMDKLGLTSRYHRRPMPDTK
jgi:cytosine/adenosine deaminase-related metal-dependent hydrolase